MIQSGGQMALFLRAPRIPPPRAGHLAIGIVVRYSSTNPVPAKKQHLVPQTGTYPLGFQVGSINVGIKPGGDSVPDLTAVLSTKSSCGAAVFTKNEMPAASIRVSKGVLHQTKGRGIQAIVANSGCANLFTGEAGLKDAALMGKETTKHMSSGLSSDGPPSAMVMHTGGIGKRLPIDAIIDGIPKLHKSVGSSHGHWMAAARGICTSDTFPKVVSRTYSLPSSPDTVFSIAGITKGAGMIHPNMATTLGIVCTDALVTPHALQQALSIGADRSYNCISVEGDTSTNDMVAMLANGAAGGTQIEYNSHVTSQSSDFDAFQEVLNNVLADMAKLVVRDAEGASKFITIRIQGSPSYSAAKHIASTIARSVLVKTRVRDPSNWVTVLAAVGYSLTNMPHLGKGVIVPELTSVSFGPGDNAGLLKVFDKGLPAAVDDKEIKTIIAKEDIEIVVNLRDGNSESSKHTEEAVYWTCDLTHEFITLNEA